MKLKSLHCGALAILAIGVTPVATALPSRVASLTSSLIMNQAAEGAAPKLESFTLVNINFGSTPSIVVKDSAGEQRTLIVNSATSFFNGGAAGTLTKFAQTCLNKTIYAQYQRSNGVVSVSKMWDSTSYTSWTNGHSGSRNGQVKGFYAKALLIGDHYYHIDDNTRFVMAGKDVVRKKLDGMPVLWIKCTVRNGKAMADVIADTSDSLGVSPTGGNTRPPSNSRPKSTGTGSSGSTNSTGQSPTERGTGRPPSTGTGTGSPTERGSGRPPSTGTGSSGSTNSTGQSPTERSNGRPTSKGSGGLSPTERAARARTGYWVRVWWEITDANDNPQGSTPGDVLGGTAKAAGVNDDTLEVFGVLRINGTKKWEIKQDDAEKNKRVRGELVKPRDTQSESFLVQSETAKLVGFLKDRDLASKSDMLFDLNLNLNLYEIWQGNKVKEYTVSGGKAKFFVEVRPK